MFNREKFLAETLIRIKVQKMLQEKKRQKLAYLSEERNKKNFRKFVRNRLVEAKKSPVPYKSTGAAVLADAIKKINPILHDDFISLTTDPAQRRSFRAHIVNGFKNALAPLRSLDGTAPVDVGGAGLGDDTGLLAAPDGALQEAPGDEFGQESGLPPEIDIDQDGIPDAEDKFIETDPDREKAAEDAMPEETPEDQAMNQFSVDGEDETGRNMALQTFKKVEKIIVDAYALLSNDKDKEEFFEFGIINLKLYFDRWEEDLQNEVPEFEV